MGIHLALVLVLSSYMLLKQVAEGKFDVIFYNFYFPSLHDFDCVDIYKQPAFQHPLLKNHKIQAEHI
ncbi:unnamed protein product [Arabis nemorensis]|uniref:Uncharacterized protein n=1 Tax=Arabis nemorensis TaxID=586526 RepID=A0A565BLV5_9BRAS|nr:unnamed protein product [Arabis nemorensis]